MIERHSASSFIIALLLSVLFPFNLILKNSAMVEQEIKVNENCEHANEVFMEAVSDHFSCE